MDRLKRRPAVAGFTLLETLFALVISAGVMVILGNILISSTHSVDYLLTDTISDEEVKRGLKRTMEELATSSPVVLTINQLNSSYDVVTLQTPGTYNGAVNWGAVDAGGVWRSGWVARYEPVSGNLVRRVLDVNGIVVGPDELLVRRLDLLSNGVKGFQVTLNGPVANVTIRIRKTFQDQKEYQKFYSSSVFLKNG